MRHDTPLRERARGKWRQILPAVGVAPAFLKNRHGPCPACGGKDRFRFDDKDGAGTFYCNSCGSGDGLKLVGLVTGKDFSEVARLVEQVIGTTQVDRQWRPAGVPAQVPQHAPATPDDAAEIAEKHRQAWGYWRSGQPITADDAAGQYLQRRLGRLVSSRALRFIPGSCSMVAGVVDMHGDLTAVQRLALTPDGVKREGDEPARKNTGTLPEGCAVRLAPYVRRLGIAEGIETALAASILYNMPVWAALNAGRLEVWTPPEGVSEVVVFGDHDLNCVGQAAAFALGKRLNGRREKDIVCQVAIAPNPGEDWADELQRRLQDAVN